MALRDQRLPAADLQARLDQLDRWTGDTSQIAKTYSVGYDEAIRLVGEIGWLAIEMEHRPDIDIRWDTLRVAMTTHTAGDVVTELDLAMAERIDTIAAEHGATSAS
jgi:4a-hydroxytetrahydrobiopterin dehydratase